LVTAKIGRKAPPVTAKIKGEIRKYQLNNATSMRGEGNWQRNGTKGTFLGNIVTNKLHAAITLQSAELRTPRRRRLE
jgi:hypothetical protein